MKTAEQTKRSLVKVIYLLVALVAILGIALGVILTQRNGADNALPPNSATADKTANNSAGTAADSNSAAPDSNSAAADSNSAAADPAAGQAIDEILANHPKTMTIGDPQAPVVLREWIDMGCPFCARFTVETLPQLEKEFIANGKMRIEVRLVSFFEGGSSRGAAAAHAAAEQGKFKEFITEVFHHAPQSGHPELTPEELLNYAQNAGVSDLKKFEQRMNDPELAAKVAADTQLAQQLGVTSVPFFAINQQALTGAQPLETFRTFINENS